MEIGVEVKECWKERRGGFRMKMVLWILLLLFVSAGFNVWGNGLDIYFVGTVESIDDGLMVIIDEVLATATESICHKVEVRGDIEGISVGDRVHVHGYYDPVNCVVTVTEEDHFVYVVPEGAKLEKLGQSIQFTGKIVRIYEMRGETFCDILVKDVLVVTFQQKEMCRTVTVRIDPVVGDVEEGLQPGDEVIFSGAYDEASCVGSLGWHDDYLKKERGLGVSWFLILGGLTIYLTLRRA